VITSNFHSSPRNEGAGAPGSSVLNRLLLVTFLSRPGMNVQGCLVVED